MILQRIKNAAWAFRNANLPMQDWNQLLAMAEMGQESAAGVRVTEETATRHATVFACINILARDMSALPRHLYERQADGGRKIVEGHPVSAWLRQPNRLHTPMQWSMRGWYSILGSGNQYEQIIRNGRGEFQTVPIDPTRVERVRVNSDLSKSYELNNPDGTKTVLPEDKVFHNFGLSTDGGITGVSPIRMCMETVGRALALGEYSAAYFRSPVPKVIAKMTGTMKDGTDAQRFKDDWTEKFAGKKGLSTLALMPPGIEIDQIVKIPNNEAQFIETAKFVKEDLAQIYMVPMHRLQALDRATFSNIEHQGLEYVQYALLPWLTALEQAIEKQFLTPEERERYFVRHNVDGLLRGDFKTRMEGSALAVQWGLATINERRALENLPAIEGGDSLLVPLNMSRLEDLPSADDIGNQGDAAGADAQADDERQVVLNRAAGMGEAEIRAAQSRRDTVARLMPRFERALQREIEIQARAITREGSPLLRAEQRDALGFISWVEEYARGRMDAVRAAVAPALLAIAQAIGDQARQEVKIDEPDDRIPAFARTWSENFAESFTRATIAQLQAVAVEAQTMLEEDPAEAVATRIDEWQHGASGKPRAGKEAGREAYSIANGVAALIFNSAGYGLVWATFGKNCPYCNSMRGKRVSGSQPFAQPGSIQPDGATRPLRIRRNLKTPPLHGGCDCMVVPG